MQVSPLLTSRHQPCRWIRGRKHHGRSARLRVAGPEEHRSPRRKRRREPLGLGEFWRPKWDIWVQILGMDVSSWFIMIDPVFFLKTSFVGYSKFGQLKHKKCRKGRHRHFWWGRFPKWLHTVCLNEVTWFETYTGKSCKSQLFFQKSWAYMVVQMAPTLL